MSFFSSKKDPSFLLSIAMKSSSIDVQLVKIPDMGTREVVFVQRKIILLENSNDPHAYVAQCTRELKTMLKTYSSEIQKLSQGKIKETSLVLYSPWFTSQIEHIRHDQQVAVQESFVQDQLKKIKTPA